MKFAIRRLSLVLSVSALFAQLAQAQTDSKPPATYKSLPSEIPANFKPISRRTAAANSRVRLGSVS